jgi:acid phosphatase
MTTLTPRAPYTPEELATLYPADLELKQVQVILRHGERTPVNARFKNVRNFESIKRSRPD